MTEYLQALATETPALKSFLLQHGPNEWNYLTPEGIDEEMALITSGDALAMVAKENGSIAGFAVLIDGRFSPRYIEQYANVNEICFIGDVVVAAEHAGKGIATALLKQCISQAENQQRSRVLIERHEENLASAGMMRKAGFSIIDTFFDPAKRDVGSQNSVILAVEL